MTVTSGPPAAFSGAVLAGGASTRMGVDKALLEVGDRRLVEISAGALTAAGAEDVVVVGGDRAGIEALGLRWIPDRYPGEGPLGGIITALAETAHDVVVVLACDHLHTEAPAVTTIVGALGTADVAIPVVDGRRQTLHAAWRTRALRPLQEAFEAGGRAVRDGLVHLSVTELLDGDPCWYRDADTPADLG